MQVVHWQDCADKKIEQFPYRDEMLHRQRL